MHFPIVHIIALHSHHKSPAKVSGDIASFGDMKIVNWRHGGKIMRDRSTIGDMAGREKELNAGHEPFSQKKKKQGRGGFARPGQGQKKKQSFGDMKYVNWRHGGKNNATQKHNK